MAYFPLSSVTNEDTGEVVVLPITVVCVHVNSQFVHIITIKFLSDLKIHV